MERKVLRTWVIILLIIGLILSIFGYWGLEELSKYEHSIPLGSEEEIDILFAGFILLGIRMLGIIFLISGGILLLCHFFQNHNSNDN